VITRTHAKRIFLFTAALSLSLIFINSTEALDRRCETAEKFYLKGNYKSAARESERLFRVYKASGIREEAAYIAALSYLKLCDYAQAREYFVFIMNSSDNSYLVSEAEIGLTNISKERTPAGKTGPARKSPFFSVQIGCFKNKGNADKLYRSFKKRKYTVRVSEEELGRSAIYKVKVGRFKTKNGAVKFSRKLRKMGYPTTVVSY